MIYLVLGLAACLTVYMARYGLQYLRFSLGRRAAQPDPNVRLIWIMVGLLLAASLLLQATG